MTDANPPELAVILPTDSLETIRETVEHLGSQSRPERLELVLVTSSPSEFSRDDPALRRFGKVQLIEIGDLQSLPEARSIGVREATAPIVVFGESHSFPQDGWAAALIEAHTGPWTVVGPSILNANPASRLGWAYLLMYYGPWVERRERALADDLPGHNSAFKRAALLAYGPDLDELMISDTLLIAELKAGGHALLFEPAARTAHLNVTRLRSFLVDVFIASRLFAALRCRRWPAWRRALYVAGAPLIPAVRLYRIVGYVRRAGLTTELLPSVLPALVLGLSLSAFAEFVGYVAGPGATSGLYEIELHRARHVRSGSRRESPA